MIDLTMYRWYEGQTSKEVIKRQRERKDRLCYAICATHFDKETDEVLGVRTLLIRWPAIVTAFLCACFPMTCLIGCATPYQSMGFRGGYAESMAGPGQYIVRAKVNGFTSQGTALAYAYQRSAELCPGGFDVVDGARSMNTTYVAQTYANGATVTEINKPEVTLVVRCR